MGWLGQLFQPLIQRFHFDWLQNGRDHRWQRVRYEALRFFWISGFAHGAKREQSPALFRQAAHQIQHSVNDSPSQIASQRTNKHRAHLTPSRLGDTERAGESKDHDQAKKDFGTRSIGSSTRLEDRSEEFPDIDAGGW